MLNWFKRRELKDALYETKKVVVKGIEFTIRKLDALSYLQGLSAIKMTYDSGQAAPVLMKESQEKKLREHYRDVLLAGVVHPVLTKKPEQDGIYVEDMFKELEIVYGIYTEIVEFTYGKKKANRFL